LSNAVRFTPEGGRISLVVAHRPDGVHIEVSDTGAGIDPTFLPRMFDRFTQGSTSKARTHGGLGLGLSIVRNLVELHGGQVTAHSEGLGKGASFDVRLPHAHPSVPVPAPSTAAPSLHAAAQLAGLHVLVVDDEPDARELIQQLLEPFGAHVTTADSAAEAIQALRQRSFGALISDIGMPDADGFELMRRVRRLEPAPRILAIALSAYAAQKDKDESLRAGFDAHVKKPVDTDELVDTLIELVNEATQHQPQERGNA
jgi:CheY-like chemotaxis protein